MSKIVARVLSFADATDRRERMTRSMEAIDCDWSFFDVVPAEGLPIGYDDEAAYLRYGSVLSAAERSCAASHLRMFETFLADSSADYLLCIEDDVMLDPYMRLDAMADFMSLCEIDYMKLYARFFVPAHFLGSVGRQTFYRPSWPLLGTQCYIVSRAGAQRHLDGMRSTGLLAPIDVMLDSYWETKFPVVLLYPFPAIELGLRSSIHFSKSTTDERNAELFAKFGRRPTRKDKLAEKIKRTLTDRSLRGFDDGLRSRIKENISGLHRAFHG